ncbi:MAG: Ig-like domain repeat protein [Lachnospiraceae bacterium]|nr:Ig-like domain repeat protein [Lachnospiraceae bacterium]
MKSIIRILIVGVTGLLIGGSILSVTGVYAAGKSNEMEISDSTLTVDISRNDGVKITPAEDEIIYTNKQLNYSVDMKPDEELFKYRLNDNADNKECDSYLDYGISCQYSISNDKGRTFEEWRDLNGGTFALIPGSITDGEYHIKFRKYEKYVMKPDEEGTDQGSENSVSANSISGNSVSANSVSENAISKNNIFRKAAEKIVEAEPIHCVESSVYYVFIDTSAPDINFLSDEKFDTWTNDSIKCCIKINDTGSGPAHLNVFCDDTQILQESYQGHQSFSGFEKEFTINSETANDSGSKLVVEAVDLSGNISTINRTVKIDKTAPCIEIAGVDNLSIHRMPVNISVAGEDAHPSTVCVGYTIKRIYGGSEETVGSSSVTLSDCREGILFTAEQDGDYLMECRATDSAGNTSPVVKKTFRIDKTPPGLGFEGAAGGGIYRNEVALKVNAFDNFGDDYIVKLTGTVCTDNGSNDLRLADYKTSGAYSQNTYYFKNDGEYTINADITDAAGNSYEDSLSFMIDKTAPAIEISSGLSVNETTVTNTPPTFSFTVRERNYETAAISCVLKKKDTEGNNVMCKTPNWIMQDETSEFSITIEDEGSYELSVRGSDAAGNSSGKTLQFTLDMTKPRIDYIENLNRKYLRSFKLPDNFREYISDNSGVNYKAYINSMNYDEGQEISEDGKYILKVSAVDDAGNQAEKTVEFIVDSTMPRVVIEGMADDGSVNKDDILVLSLYDTDDYFVSVKLNGEEMVTDEKQQEVKVLIPDYGDYRIEIEASDMADNILTQTIEAKCANAAPVSKGISTMRTLKQNEKSGSNKGLRIALIILTVLTLAGTIIVYCVYTAKTAVKQ